MKTILRVFAAGEMKPRSVTFLLLFLAVLGIASVLLRELAFGVALHWDSVNYIVVARNLLDGGGFTQATWFWDVSPQLTVWPPLYPLLLSASSFFIFDPYDVAGPVNAVIFGLTVFVSGKWMWPLLESRFLRLWGCLAIALSVPLAWAAASAMPGSLFTLLATISMINVERFIRGDKCINLVWAATFAGLACMTRYPGIVIITTTAVLLMVKPGFLSMKGIGQALMYVSVSSFPLLLWGGRNIMMGSPFFGVRNSGVPDIASVSGIVEALKEFVAPAVPLDNHLPYSESLSAVVAFGILLLTLVASLTYLLVSLKYRFASVRDGAEWYRWSPFIVFGTFSLISLIMTLGMMGGVGHGVQTRYIVPMWLPLFFTLIFFVDRLMCHRGKKGYFRTVVLSLIIPWCLYSGLLNAEAIIRTNESGTPHTFSDPRWHNSDVLQFLSDSPLSGRVYSPTVPPLYMVNDSAKAYLNPYGTEAIHKALNESTEGDYFVFFFGINCECDHQDYYLSPKLALVAELSDGVIFRRSISSTSSPDPAPGRVP